MGGWVGWMGWMGSDYRFRTASPLSFQCPSGLLALAVGHLLLRAWVWAMLLRSMVGGRRLVVGGRLSWRTASHYLRF